MKKLAFILLFMYTTMYGFSQYVVSTPQAWDKYPPEAQKRGFGLHASQLVQMDNEPALEDVLLFSAHNGHYPYFDLFKNYYVIIDNYTKEIKYISGIIISTERELILEDRNNDGKFELYRRYFKDGEFKVDEYGNNLSVKWVYDRIEWVDKQGIVNNKKK